jgi:hypothetical protein
MDYKLIAKIDKESSIIFTFDDTINLDKFNDMNYITCESCNTNRDRKYFYIVQDETGQLSQHGQSCFIKLMNVNELTHFEKQIFSNDNIIDFNRYKVSYDEVEKFIIKLILINNDNKFNKDTVLNHIKTFNFSNYSTKTIENASEIYVNVINYYKNYNGYNEFINNVKNLVLDNKWFNIKYINLMKWSYQLYLQNLNYLKEENDKRIKFIIKSIKFNGTRTYPFVYSQYEIMDKNDNKYIYNTSNILMELDSYIDTEVSAKIHSILKNGTTKIKSLKKV